MRPLVIRYRKLGDTLMVTPILRALIERGETFAVGEAAYEQIFTNVGIAGFEAIRSPEPSRLALIRAGLRARRFRCDTALVLRFNRRASIVARLAGCPVRAGGTRLRVGWLNGLTQNAYDPEIWAGSHQVEKYYSVAEAAVGLLPRYPTFFAADQLDGMPPGYVVVHLGNGGSNLSWPDESFGTVIDRFHAEGLPVVVSGDRSANFPHARSLADVDLVGQTNLNSLAGLFKGARFVVGLDGGGARLASAVGTPVTVLALGHKWSPHQASPWMAPGIVVASPVTPESVIQAALGLL